MLRLRLLGGLVGAKAGFKLHKQCFTVRPKMFASSSVQHAMRI